MKGVQDIQYTEFSLLEQLERCAELLVKAERYELLGDLYRLIIPIYEEKRNYEMLAHCYQNLTQAYNKIIEVTRSGKRLLGRYYRVAFFGQVILLFSLSALVYNSVFILDTFYRHTLKMKMEQNTFIKNQN